MLQISMSLTALTLINFLTYLIKSQSEISKVALVLLFLVICINLVATLMPTLICELWGLTVSKVTANSLGLWFWIGAGIVIGIGV